MKVVLTLLALVVAPLAIAAELQDNKGAVKEDMQKLQGRWQVIKWVDSSEKPALAEEIKDLTFEFKGDSVIQQSGKFARPAKYILDPSKKPKWIDIDEGGKRVTYEGIYKLEGDELSLCFVAGERNSKAPPRPSEFKASGKAPYAVFVLKRVKK